MLKSFIVVANAKVNAWVQTNPLTMSTMERENTFLKNVWGVAL
jgi:hypothetical protein